MGNKAKKHSATNIIFRKTQKYIVEQAHCSAKGQSGQSKCRQRARRPNYCQALWQSMFSRAGCPCQLAGCHKQIFANSLHFLLILFQESLKAMGYGSPGNAMAPARGSKMEMPTLVWDYFQKLAGKMQCRQCQKAQRTQRSPCLSIKGSGATSNGGRSTPARRC